MLCPAEGGRMTKELIRERGQAEVASWQLVVTHSVALTPWEKIFRDAMPSFDCKNLQFNVFQHWGNCGENSLSVSIVQAVQQVSGSCPHPTHQQGCSVGCMQRS